MDLENKADITATPAVAPDAGTTPASEPSQPNPLQAELDRVEQHRSGRTKREKLEFTLSRVKQQLAELDGEAGVDTTIEVDKTKAVTFADLDRIEHDRENRRAVDMAESIQDDVERKLTIHYLENTIRPSGNAETDLANARAIVNAKRNALIAEEASRGTRPNSFVSAPGAPMRPAQEVFEPTAQEAQFMRAPFNLTKEDIIAARNRAQK
jgi:hypothetical protein